MSNHQYRQSNLDNLRSDQHLGMEAHGIKEKMKHTAENALHRAEDMLEKAGGEMRKHSVEVRDAVSHYVKENPYKSLGTAAMLGALVALLLRK